VGALDGLRGLAILMVLFVHFLGDFEAHTPTERLLVKGANYGVWGVDLFFVLSGFLITGILWDSRSSPGYFRTFYVRRTLRIFPLYYATLFLLLVAAPVLGHGAPGGLDETAEHGAWLWTYTSNVYLATAGAWSLPYVSHFWSLAVEEQYYLLWPFVVLACSRRALLAVCGASALFALGLRIVLARSGASDVALVALTPCRLDALCVGAGLALATRSFGVARVGQAARPWALLFPAGVLLVSVWNVAVGSFREVAIPLRGTLVALSFGALLVTALVTPAASLLGRALNGNYLRFLGKYSYGTYVFHGIIAYELDRRVTIDGVTTWLGSRPGAMILQAVVGASLAVVAAVASYELFEKHFLRLKDILAPSRSGASTASVCPPAAAPSATAVTAAARFGD